MRIMDFPKRIARLVEQDKVHQTVRSDRWADATIGEQIAAYVGLNHGEICHPDCQTTVPGPGKYARRVRTLTIAGNVPLNMTEEVLVVNGVEVEDKDAFAYLEGWGDWVQLSSWVFDHCGYTETPDGTKMFTGVLLTWT